MPRELLKPASRATGVPLRPVRSFSARRLSRGRTSHRCENTPQLTASVAPTRVFGLPVYASIDNDFSYLPFREINDGKVENDRSLARFEVAPAVRAALSRLSFLTVNTSASYRTTYFSRSADARRRDDRTADAPVSPGAIGRHRSGLFKDLGYAGQPFQRAQKHLIEPTFVLEYIPPISNASRVLKLADSRRDSWQRGTVTYGLNNRFLSARAPRKVRPVRRFSF